MLIIAETLRVGKDCFSKKKRETLSLKHLLF
jgi:hypothetical protein